MVSLCIPTIRRFDTLTRCVESALRGTLVPNIYIIDNSGGKLLDYAEQHWNFDCEISVVVPKRNLGVAGSWNVFLEGLPDNVVISNDDVVFHKNTLELLHNAAETFSNTGLFIGSSAGENSWSLFLQKQWLTSLVGLYDETFYPAYFEDNDYFYRMSLVKQTYKIVDGCQFDHVGSATLKDYTPDEMEWHHQNFRANEAYYRQKWGGLPGSEQFKTAFNR